MNGESSYWEGLKFVRDKWDKIVGRRDREPNAFKMLLRDPKRTRTGLRFHFGVKLHFGVR